MAIKVNDDGQRMMLTDDVLDRIRLTADMQGSDLGWVLLKDIIDLIGMTDLGVIQSNAIDTLVKRGVYKYTRTYMDFGKSVQQDGVIFVQGDKVPISGSGDYTIYQVCFEGCSIKVRSKGSSGLIWSEWNEIGGNINIVQTTGESKTDVMSQSAVTYVLNKKMNAPLTTFSTKDEVEHCVDIGNYSVFLYENPYPILGDSFTLLVLNLNADGDSYMQVGISYTGNGYVMAARSGSEGSWSEWKEIGSGIETTLREKEWPENGITSLIELLEPGIYSAPNKSTLEKVLGKPEQLNGINHYMILTVKRTGIHLIQEYMAVIQDETTEYKLFIRDISITDVEGEILPGSYTAWNEIGGINKLDKILGIPLTYNRIAPEEGGGGSNGVWVEINSPILEMYSTKTEQLDMFGMTFDLVPGWNQLVFNNRERYDEIGPEAMGSSIDADAHYKLYHQRFYYSRPTENNASHGDFRIGYITNSDAELEYIYGITDIRFPYSGSERAEYIQHMFEAFNAPLCPLEILVQV